MQNVHLPARGQIKTSTKGEVKLQTTSQTLLQPHWIQNTGEEEQDTSQHEAMRAEHLDKLKGTLLTCSL